MSDTLPRNQVVDTIRKQWYQGEWYYHVVDFVSFTLNTNFKNAGNYYPVLKSRLIKNKQPIPTIEKLKSRASDGKMYFSDFTNDEGIQLLKGYLQIANQRKEIRTQITKRDEVFCFHPKVIHFFHDLGWNVQHHIALPSKHIIDVIASLDGFVYVVECKPELTNAKLYNAIGQVLCYRNEYDANAVPAIATYSRQITDYSYQCCSTLGIKLFAIRD